MNVLHIFRSVELAPTLLVSFIFTFMLFHVIFRSLLFTNEIKIYSPEINFYSRWYRNYKSDEIVNLDLDVSIYNEILS